MSVFSTLSPAFSFWQRLSGEDESGEKDASLYSKPLAEYIHVRTVMDNFQYAKMPIGYTPAYAGCTKSDEEPRNYPIKERYCSE